MTDLTKYNDFIAGRDPQPLIDVMGTSDIARGICSTLLNRDETYAENQKGQKIIADLIINNVKTM